MFQESVLSNSLATFEIADCSDIFQQLSAAYGSTDRHYHDQTHISECLEHLSRNRDLADRCREIEIAIWFHDAIYDTTQQDNEERSADWVQAYLGSHGVASDAISRIYNMIIATKTHTPKTNDQALLIDIDLGILGTSWDVFEGYDRAIRNEYSWVPKEQYVAGRVNVLCSFLERPNIYHTAPFREMLEGAARENLVRKIKELS